MSEIERLAREEHVTVGEWVQRRLREARSGKRPKDAEAKLRAVRKAMEYEFPTADIDTMLAEIEKGYRS